MTRARTLADLGSASLATDAELAAEVATLDSTISGLALGKVLQVVHGSTQTNTTNNTNSFVNTSLSASITPLSDASTMLLIARFGLGIQGSQTGANMPLMSRFAYSISGGSSGNLTSAVELAYDSRSTGPQLFGQENIPAALTDFHSHGTTSSITYTVQLKGNTTASTNYRFGRYNGDGNTTIVILEVAA